MQMSVFISKKHSFIEVYESIMFTFLRGISTEKGAEGLESFILDYRKKQVRNEIAERQENN